MVGYEQCRKIADTPFPFPWAQFVFVSLLMFTFSCPLLIIAYVPNTGLAIFLSVLSVSTYWGCNEVARDIEDPFLYEPNELPLPSMQFELNHMLLAAMESNRPSSNIENEARKAASPLQSSQYLASDIECYQSKVPRSDQSPPPGDGTVPPCATMGHTPANSTTLPRIDSVFLFARESYGSARSAGCCELNGGAAVND